MNVNKYLSVYYAKAMVAMVVLLCALAGGNFVQVGLDINQLFNWYLTWDYGYIHRGLLE